MNTGDSRDTKAQGSVLLRLPLELRQLIWQKCLGGMTFHVRSDQNGLFCTICRSPTPDLCPNVRGHGGCREYSEHYLPKSQVLSVLLTCRQV